MSLCLKRQKRWCKYSRHHHTNEAIRSLCDEVNCMPGSTQKDTINSMRSKKAVYLHALAGFPAHITYTIGTNSYEGGTGVFYFKKYRLFRLFEKRDWTLIQNAGTRSTTHYRYRLYLESHFRGSEKKHWAKSILQLQAFASSNKKPKMEEIAPREL